ncbi:uncharacterized protein G2W53_037490 [Senna tora]|uniref:Uncharacterized protein n=1 Tax=Senna tora TaxID=362788 RepID=A0A834SKB1_9FABA|nr:uncharacterized protein G2W53_037490 [Senna tora]
MYGIKHYKEAEKGGAEKSERGDE